MLQVLLFSFGRDQSIYAQVARTVLDGGMPYQDAWDFKPPGIFLVYAFAESLFGHSVTSVRILEAGGMLVLVWCFRRFAAYYFGNASIGLLGGTMACLSHAQLEFWHTGQPETFGGVVTALALVVTAWQPTRRSRRWQQWLGVGALFGLAFLLKPPLGGGAVVCSAYLARREHERFIKASSGTAAIDDPGSPRLVSAQLSALAALVPLVVAAVASVLVLGAVGSWFFVRGAWADFAWTLFEFTPNYTKLSWTGGSPLARLYSSTAEVLWKFSAFPPVGALMVVAMPPLHSREREGLSLVIGVAAIQLIGVVMQGKFFQYHYAATLSLVALIGGLGFWKLWIRAAVMGKPPVVAYFSLMAVVASLRTGVQDVPGTFWERSATRMKFLVGTGDYRSRAELDDALYKVADFDLAADREVADLVTQLSPPEARVFVWGFEPMIYWLSQRQPASRYIYNVPQRVSWESARARSQLLQDLSDPPRIFIVQHNDVFNWVTGNALDSDGALAEFPELKAFLDSRYQKLRRVEDFDLYVPRESTEHTGP